MIEFLCRCGNSASIEFNDGIYRVSCGSCNRESGPSGSFDEVYREWYGLVPMRSASQDVCESIRSSIMAVSESSRVASEDVLEKCPDRDAGRRALNILLDCGLIDAIYIHKGEEVDFANAMEAKKSGDKVSVYFSKAFSSRKLE